MDRTFVIQPQSGLQYDWQAIAANPQGNHAPQMDIVAYKALYINMIAQARAHGQEPVLVSLPVLDENRFFAYITRGMSMSERRNLFYWLGGSTSRLRDLHEMYNLALFRLAAVQCVPLVDITSPMLACARPGELLAEDGISLSSAGRSLVESVLAKAQAHAAA